MPRSGPGLRIPEPPVHCATQGPPSHALRWAAVEGVGIAHGGPPALGAQQHQRQGAGALDRRPRPPLPPSPLPPQRRHHQARPRSAGDSELGAAGSGWVREGWGWDLASGPAASKPLACLGSLSLGSILWSHDPSQPRHGRRPCPATSWGPAPGGAA